MSPTRRQLLDGPRSTFQIGEALSKTFSVWGSNLLPLVLVTLIVNVPTLFFMRQELQAVGTKDAQLWSALAQVSSGLMGVLATGAVTYAVVQQLRGRPCGMGEALSVGAARFFPVIGVALLSMLCILGGLLLLFVPGVIASLMLFVATPVAIIERPGVVASLKRSSELTKGVKLPLFVLLYLIIGIATGILMYTLGMGIRSAELTTKWVVLGATHVLVQSFSAVLPAVIYVLLRKSRDGASVEDLAKVFD